MSVAVTVPNGAVPQVPLQKSDVRLKLIVAAEAEVAVPIRTAVTVRIPTKSGLAAPVTSFPLFIM
jgi:hypothetical protein